MKEMYELGLEEQVRFNQKNIRGRVTVCWVNYRRQKLKCRGKYGPFGLWLAIH